MELWILFAIMSLVAVGFAVWPLYRRQQRLSAAVLLSVIVIVAVSAGLYGYQGQPEVPSGGGAGAEMDEVIASLAARLEENPGDANGWKMLGRSYMALGNFSGAIDAFSKANDLESGQDAQTLVSLGEAQLASGGGTYNEQISALFESALAIDPNNPQALFYAGIAAFNRDDPALAANRWERLLSLNPPAEIEGILRQRIAEWRGEPPPVAAHPPVTEPVPETDDVPQPRGSMTEEPSDGAVVSAALSLSAEAKASLPADGIVFIIARDPAQPSPPIAVTRRRLVELPVQVELGDRESMVAGRSLSTFAEFELVARVSLSGQPAQQPGDWYGSVIVVPEEQNVVELTVSEQVP